MHMYAYARQRTEHFFKTFNNYLSQIIKNAFFNLLGERHATAS